MGTIRRIKRHAGYPVRGESGLSRLWRSLVKGALAALVMAVAWVFILYALGAQVINEAALFGGALMIGIVGVVGAIEEYFGRRIIR